MSRPLEDVQDEILDRIHAGETVDRDAVVAAHPEHEEALRALFEVLALIEGTGDEDEIELSRLGEFRIIREIGRGGMGRVYEAEQVSLKRRVALKVLPPTLRLDPRLVSRFRREAEAAGRLRHPGIVPVFSVGEAAGAPFFAMELVEGASLREVIAQRRAGDDAGLPATPEGWRAWAVETAARVADALAHAHEKGILHRDVKPANILLDEGGAPRLTDFGLALDLRAPEFTQTGEVFGSLMYMSPEQALRREVPIDERTDVYSLAVTLYELLTLRLPYAATTNAEVLTALVNGQVTPPRNVDPSMPRALEQVLLGALHADPRHRYHGAAAFAHDLRAVMEGQAPAHKPAESAWPRWRVPVAVAAAVLLFASGIFFASRGWFGGSAGTGETPADIEAERATADAILHEYLSLGPAVTPDDYEVAFDRLRVLAPAASEAARRRISEGYVGGPGRDDPEARALLGHREFAHAVPEAITYRGHPYLRVVEAASAKRWFTADEEEDWLLAQRAWQETLRFESRLAADADARAVESTLARLGEEERLDRYHLTPRWASPYLICHLGAQPVSEYDLFGVTAGEERETRRAALASRSERAELDLDVTARECTSLHAEYMKRFGPGAGLKPLMAPWGGRPDLEPGAEAFKNGAPLVVLLFASRDAWRSYHADHAGAPLPPTVHSYFSIRNGRILVAAPAQGKASVPSEQSNLLHEGTHQLQYWFRRQRHAWEKPAAHTSWFEEGLGEYMSGVRRSRDGKMVFDGYNRHRLEALQSTRKTLQRQGKAYPLFPLEALAGFGRFADVMRWTAANGDVPPSLGLALFYQQAWALTYFLNEYEDGQFRKPYQTLFGSALTLRPSDEPVVQFRKALDLESSEAFQRLEDLFHAYVMDELMILDPRGRQFN